MTGWEKSVFLVFLPSNLLGGVMPQVKLKLSVADELFTKWLEDLAGERLLPNLAEVKQRISLASGLLPLDVQMEIEDSVAMNPTSKRIASMLIENHRLSLRVVGMDICVGNCEECILEELCRRRIGEVVGRYLTMTPALSSPVVRAVLKLEV